MMPSALHAPHRPRVRLCVGATALTLLGACATRGSMTTRPTVPVDRRSTPVVLAPVVGEAELAYLHDRQLLVPVAGVQAARLRSNFTEPRTGDRTHRALDIMAPKGTPVLAADDGRIWRLRIGGIGGITIYATDPTSRFVYYYAHLDRYRPGLAEGMAIARGDTLGYVGNTGNAKYTPSHLHFQVSALGDDRRYWGGTPIDPLPFLQEAEVALAAAHRRAPAERATAERATATDAAANDVGALVGDTVSADGVPLMTAAPLPAPPRARARPRH